MRQVPWESWQQWHHVRCSLFSESSSRIAEALDRVAAWRSRGQVPVSVDITAELISIHWRDSQVTGGLSQHSVLPEEMLRMMYAMAIMRLVNGVVDQSQKRNTMSVAARAETAQLPRLLVDIRHEAAHNELPGLPLLRHASKQALAWLQAHYWEVQQQVLHNARMLLKSKLVEHSQLVHESLQPQQVFGNQMDGQTRKQQKKQLKRFLQVAKQRQRAVFRELLELAHSAVSDVVSILVDDGVLVHDNWPTTAPTVNGVAGLDVEDDEDIADDEDSKSGLESSGTLTTFEWAAAVAWKETLIQLSAHIPQLPMLLLVAIIEHMAGLHPSDLDTSDGYGLFKSSALPDRLPECSDPVASDRYIGWATWILGEGHLIEDDRTVSNGSGKARSVTWTGLKSNMPVELARQLVGICLKSTLNRKFLGKLVPNLAERVGDSSYLHRVVSLARYGPNFVCGRIDCQEDGQAGQDADKNGPGKFVGGSEENHSQGYINASTDFAGKPQQCKMHSPESALKEARQQQQAFLEAFFVSEAVEDTWEPAQEKPSGKVGQWSRVEGWEPCALGMLPSPYHCRGIIPKLSKTLMDVSRQKTFSQEVKGGVTVKCKNQQGEVECLQLTQRAIVEPPRQLQLETDEPSSLGEKGLEPEHDAKRLKVVQFQDEVLENEPALRTQVDRSPKTQILSDDKGDECFRWQGCLLQGGFVQPCPVQDLASLQAAIHVL